MTISITIEDLRKLSRGTPEERSADEKKEGTNRLSTRVGIAVDEILQAAHVAASAGFVRMETETSVVTLLVEGDEQVFEDLLRSQLALRGFTGAKVKGVPTTYGRRFYFTCTLDWSDGK